MRTAQVLHGQIFYGLGCRKIWLPDLCSTRTSLAGLPLQVIRINVDKLRHVRKRTIYSWISFGSSQERAVSMNCHGMRTVVMWGLPTTMIPSSMKKKRPPFLIPVTFLQGINKGGLPIAKSGMTARYSPSQLMPTVRQLR